MGGAHLMSKKGVFIQLLHMMIKYSGLLLLLTACSHVLVYDTFFVIVLFNDWFS